MKTNGKLRGLVWDCIRAGRAHERAERRAQREADVGWRTARRAIADQTFERRALAMQTLSYLIKNPHLFRGD